MIKGCHSGQFLLAPLPCCRPEVALGYFRRLVVTLSVRNCRLRWRRSDCWSQHLESRGGHAIGKSAVLKGMTPSQLVNGVRRGFDRNLWEPYVTIGALFVKVCWGKTVLVERWKEGNHCPRKLRIHTSSRGTIAWRATQELLWEEINRAAVSSWTLFLNYLWKYSSLSRAHP